MKVKFYILFLLFFSFINSMAQTNTVSADLNGQLIGWTNFNFDNTFSNQYGLRYIPEFSIEYYKNNDWKIDGEISVNAYGSATYFNKDWSSSDNLKPYRMWLRYSTKQFELRAGLQKINFGSSNMLRPLMWFDRIDARDPLRLTDGVNALLARYYFLNNANIWAWLLYANEEPGGWDVIPTRSKIPEAGGRIQLPIGKGEIGLSYHYRQIGGDSVEIASGSILNLPEKLPQTKIGLDGKWDLGPGVWFEYVFKSNKLDQPYLYNYEHQISLGMDYTFALGSGLNAGMEHFIWMGSRTRLDDITSTNHFSAMNLSYPLSMMNNLSTIIYYSWTDESWYRFINLSRQYDNLSLYLMAYWNPENFNIFPGSEDANMYFGKGFQFMITFNH